MMVFNSRAFRHHEAGNLNPNTRETEDEGEDQENEQGDREKEHHDDEEGPDR